jgi:hypothetical protein
MRAENEQIDLLTKKLLVTLKIKRDNQGTELNPLIILSIVRTLEGQIPNGNVTTLIREFE